MLYSVFQELTHKKCELVRGDHWGSIGFQGTDPSTDFRGGGLLSLLCLLYFVTETDPIRIVDETFQLSLDPVHNFPFVLVGVNITSILLRLMRQEKLNRTFNSRKNVLDTFMLMYSAVFWLMGSLWEEEQCTILQMETVLKRLEEWCERKPNSLLKRYEKLSWV
ncbi:unnamed protein product [Calicophoron daubneyi]|uniref:ELMO domain-containing protein n=1 Tax=Calicophoron daubneyi TaxID=300641 RepID=A0AAV2T637_CALDB